MQEKNRYLLLSCVYGFEEMAKFSLLDRSEEIKLRDRLHMEKSWGDMF